MNTLDEKLKQNEGSAGPQFAFIFLLFLIGILGSSGFLFAPFWVGGLIGSAGWTIEDAGFLMSAELVGAAIGSLCMLLGRTAWLTAAGLVTLALANSATAYLLYASPDAVQIISGTRVLGGLGGGACLAATYVGLSTATNPDRLFALFLGVTLLVSGIGFYAFPPAMEALGLIGLYGVWAGAVLAGACLFFFTPLRFVSNADASKDGSIIDAGAILLSLFLLFSAQGAIWTFLEPIATDAKVEPEKLGLVLALSSVAGFLGGIVNAAQGDRLGRRWPVMAGLVPTLALVWALSPPTTETLLAIAVCGLQFFWCYAIPFLMGGLSERLKDRRGMAAGVFVQLAGFGVGPFIVSWALTSGQGLSIVVYTAIAFTLLTLIATFPALAPNRSLE